MENKILKEYLREIIDISKRGDATEGSYYSILKKLIAEYANSVNKNISITTLPKKTEVGYPDFKIWGGVSKEVGYIEAKSPTVENLDYIAQTEQLKKYKDTFPNLILTNFYEFRLYREKKEIRRVQITFPPLDIQTSSALKNETELFNLLDKFLSFSIPSITTAKKLAEELAKRTRFLQEDIMNVDEIKSDENILGFHKAFKDFLIPDLTYGQFADLFSQTLTYGLFASRTRTRGKFNRKNVYENIPHKTLREIFKYFSQEKIPEQLECIIDDITEILATTNVNKILTKYIHRQYSLSEDFTVHLEEKKTKDPIYHFYETFLAEYDPAKRKHMGVYYTPLPIVSYIVRSLNTILKEKFNKSGGFANKEITVLDPAGGTLTFLAEATNLAVKELRKKYGEGSEVGWIKNHILNNFYAFELMMASYTIGHLKMSFLLKDLGCGLKEDDEIKFYLTNTLEKEEIPTIEIPGIARTLSEEAQKANKVKETIPILVILGNPPYYGHSYNKGKWITDLIKDYRMCDGKPLGERNPKWLQDDYVKFIRFAQWKVEQLGEGMIGFITNHSYLDNVTFRGMRQSLMNSFNEIYVLNLHGNVRKGEKAPDESKDENVFDIQQGVAISLFIKNKSQEKNRIYYYELRGLRKDKEKWLRSKDKNTTQWQEVKSHSPYYFFIPKEEKYYKIYHRYPSIKDIFPVNSVGVVTAKDQFVIDFEMESLKNRILMFKNSSIPDEQIRRTFNLKDTGTFKLKEAREKLSKDKDWDKHFTKILYRPFDVRHIYYNKILIERPRAEVMHHMMKGNLGFITRRQMLPNQPCNYVFVSDKVISDGVIRSDNKGSESLFPLWLYPEDIFNNKNNGERKANIDAKILNSLQRNYKKKITPEDMFYYIYGVLYSNTYREKYHGFLKIDFPRIPFTKDYKVFGKIKKLGKRLVNLHLLKLDELDTPIVKFHGRKGDTTVKKIEYKDAAIYINPNKYFLGITPKVWEYQIGGYKVLQKYLKERKDRLLSSDESIAYSRIASAIIKTIEIQREIDKIYPKIEDSLMR